MQGVFLPAHIESHKRVRFCGALFRLDLRLGAASHDSGLALATLREGVAEQRLDVENFCGGCSVDLKRAADDLAGLRSQLGLACFDISRRDAYEGLDGIDGQRNA